jgi:hypothetical protein
VPLEEILDALRTSRMVKRIVSKKFDGIPNFYALKVRAEMTNGWFLDCWEHKTPKSRRYSFHVFHRDQMVVRWDNTPHYPTLRGFPNHKHEGKSVVQSENMTIRKVLNELTKMAKAE